MSGISKLFTAKGFFGNIFGPLDLTTTLFGELKKGTQQKKRSLPTVPSRSSAEVQEAARRERLRLQGLRGVQQNIFAGGRLGQQANLGTRTLLGE